MSDQPPPLGAPGPLTQAAIEKAKSFPANQLELDVATTDFRTVDATFGVRKTWRNGWGAGAWVGAKLGAGKPIGSAGVSVTKTLGLLERADAMNWLQRTLPARESWTWPIATIAAVLSVIAADYDLFQAAFELEPKWENRIKFLAGLSAVLTAKQSFSWMPTKDKQTQAKIEVKFRRNLEKEIRDIDQAGDR